MRLRPTLLLFLGLLVAISLASTLNAQTTTSGGLAGVVTDPTSAVLPDADVVILDNAKGTTQSTNTDRDGVYRFFFLAPGRYALTVTHAGFREEKRAVYVTLGPPVSVNLTLEIAQASTTVNVADEAPLVQAENGDVSATMGQKQISEVPNPGNDLTYVVQTAPGVVMNTDSSNNTLGNFSILGMPGTSYHYTNDGVDENENSENLSMTGSLGLVLGQNQIQEATIVSTGYSGQFGGAAGGNINYLSKSGTREFHGNAQYYWNGRALNANDWFNNAFGYSRPFSIANQWAGSFGGPISKGKLFFFFDSNFAQTHTCGSSLAAGASCTISVTFKPTASGTRSAALSVTDNAAGSPQKVTLSGIGTTAKLSPTSLNFGTVAIGTTSAAKTATLTNVGTTSLSINGVAITGTNAGDFAQTHTCGSSLAAGASCTISVTFKPTASGTRSAALSVTDNAAGSPQKVPVSGIGTTAKLSPTSLSFGTVAIGTTSPAKTVTLTNVGTTSLSITGIAITGTNTGDFAQTHTCGTSLAAGASCSINVTFKPTASGTRTATLSISDNGGGSPQSVPLSGTGVGSCTPFGGRCGPGLPRCCPAPFPHHSFCSNPTGFGTCLMN